MYTGQLLIGMKRARSLAPILRRASLCTVPCAHYPPGSVCSQAQPEPNPQDATRDTARNSGRAVSTVLAGASIHSRAASPTPSPISSSAIRFTRSDTLTDVRGGRCGVDDAASEWAKSINRMPYSPGAALLMRINFVTQRHFTEER